MARHAASLPFTVGMDSAQANVCGLGKLTSITVPIIYLELFIKLWS